MPTRRPMPTFRPLLLGLACACALLAPAGLLRAGARGIPFRPGDRLATAIRPAGDADDFVFDGLADGRLRLDVRAAKGSPFAPALELRDPDGAAIDLSGLLRARRGRLRLRSLRLTATGRYLLRIGAGDGGAGEYVLATKGKPPGTVRLRGVPLPAGGTVDLPFGGDSGATLRAVIRAKGKGGFEVRSVLAPGGEEIPAAPGAFSGRGASRKAKLRLEAGFGEYRIRVGAVAGDALLHATLRVKHPRTGRRRIEITPDEPRIDRVEPALAAAGEAVAVLGENFLPGAVLELDGEPGATAALLSPTEFAAEAPEGAGDHDVTVVNPDGQEHTLSAALRVAPLPPAIEAVSPAAGPVEGGRRVEVTGARLSGVAGLTLGGRELAGPIEVVDDGRIRFTTEPGEAGLADLAVRDGEGRSVTLEDAYRFVHPIHGLNFSPFLEGQDPNEGFEVSAAQVELLLREVAGYCRWIRIFGLSGGLAEAGRIAGELQLLRAIGAWLGSDAEANAEEIGRLIDVAKAGRADLAIVGSEALLRGDLGEEELLAYLEQVRAALDGRDVPVTTADIWSVLLDHPAVIEACDVVLVNIYPYWEGVPIEDAVAVLDERYSRVVAAAGGKKVVVSETGWPSDGDAVGGAVPSPENAARYFLEATTWAKAKGVEVFWFSSRDEAWKAAHEGPQGAHWGIFDEDGEMKPGMADVFDGKSSGDTWSDVLVDGPGTPEIAFTSVPATGSTDDLEGRVSHVFAYEYRVAVYIRVPGLGWWTKPTAASPLTPIRRSGGFVCDVTTGGADATADRIAAYLVPADSTPPLLLGEGSLPASLSTLAVASVEISRP